MVALKGAAWCRLQSQELDVARSSTDAMLFLEMSTAEREGKSVKNKARLLTKTHPKFKGKNPGTLRERYYLLKDPQSVEGQRLRDLIAFAIAQDNKVAG